MHVQCLQKQTDCFPEWLHSILWPAAKNNPVLDLADLWYYHHFLFVLALYDMHAMASRELPFLSPSGYSTERLPSSCADLPMSVFSLSLVQPLLVFLLSFANYLYILDPSSVLGTGLPGIFLCGYMHRMCISNPPKWIFSRQKL